MNLSLLLYPFLIISCFNVDKVDNVSLSTYYFEVDERQNYYESHDFLTVNGNYNDINIDTKSNKIQIYYDLNIEDNNKNNPLNQYNALIMYTENNIKKSSRLLTTTTDKVVLTKEIEEFINEKMNDIQQKTKINTKSYKEFDNKLFNLLYEDEIMQVTKPYFFYRIKCKTYKYRVNDVSSLFNVDTTITFTPGKDAKINLEGYKNYIFKNISIMMYAQEARIEYDQSHIRYGGTPILKDTYPSNDPVHVNITSSYSTGLSIGHSFANGFSTDGITIEENKSLGKNIEFGYSKSISTTDPHISCYKDDDINSNIYYWNLNYKANIYSYDFNFGYIFEQNNSGHGLGEDNVFFTYEIKSEVSGTGLFAKKKKFHDLHAKNYA